MAELALAIVPIFFSAVRGFSLIREKAHLLRHYHREIKRLRDKVDAQCRNLKGEIHHLIIDTLEVHLADSIIRDDDHEYWKNAALEAALKRHLGNEYPNFVQGIEEINAELAEITNKLAVFTPPDVRVSMGRVTVTRSPMYYCSKVTKTLLYSQTDLGKQETNFGWSLERRNTLTASEELKSQSQN